MRRLLAGAVLLASCLDAPPSSVGDVGADAGLISCPAEIEIPFTSEADIAGWTPEIGEECTITLTAGGLEFRNMGAPSTCRVFADARLDMRGGALQVRLNDADANLNMAVSLVLGPAGQSFSSRHWLYFERDESVLNFGTCEPGPVCEDARFGSIDYSPTTHLYLRFRHEPDDGRVDFETSDDGDSWQSHSTAEGVTSEDLSCVGIDLASYEEMATDVDSTSRFVDLKGGALPALTRP